MRIYSDAHYHQPFVQLSSKQLFLFFRNVKLRHLRITHHATGKGIFFDGCHGIQIENVEVVAVGHDGSLSPNPCRNDYDRGMERDCDSVHGLRSEGVVITNIRATGGSTGVELSHCPGAQLSQIMVFNVRGPFPRGQCVQVEC